MTSLKCHFKSTPMILLVVSGCLIASSLVILFLVPSIIRHQISQSLPLLNNTNSKTYDKWQTIPIPIMTSFYVFNITNPEDVEQGRAPVVKELGPYVFAERREKENVSYSEDETIVSYGQKRTWFFRPDLSFGSLKDIVYHLNVPMTAAASQIRNWDKPFLYFAINRMIEATHSKLIPRHTVGQLLFEGYDDPLIKFARDFKMPVPYDKFGWFYGRNASISDGVFQVYTGKSDLNKMDEMYSWNGNRTLHYWWGDKCNSFEKISASDFQPPFQQSPSEYIKIFVGDICRPLKLPFYGVFFKNDVKSYRYAATSALFDYTEPENVCFCEDSNIEKCPPKGVADISPCQHGSPSGASLPHFLFGDAVLFERVKGLDPNPLKHEFYMDIEPTLGVATKVKVAMQINVLLEKDPRLDFAKKMEFDKIYFPMIWFKATAELDEAMAYQLKILQNLPQVLNLFAGVFASVGILLLLITLIVFRSQIWSKDAQLQLVPSQDVVERENVAFLR